MRNTGLVYRRGKENIGTGFFAQNSEGVTFLLTAAHVPTGTQPHINRDIRPDSLFAKTVGGQDIKFDLFAPLPIPLPHSIPRIPMFRWRYNVDGKSMADMLALRLGDNLASSGAMAPTNVIKLDKGPWHPNAKSHLTGFGFPNAANSWPYRPTVQTVGSVITVNTNLIQAQMPVIDGFSGGPLFSAQDQFIGMMIGHNGLTKMASANAISAMINGQLEGILTP